VLYYCLTGQYPFPDGSSAEKMMAHQFNEPTPLRELNPDVPPELVDVVKRLMQKVPENRFPSAGAVVEALQLLADVPAAGAMAPPPPPPRAAGGGRAGSAGPRLFASEADKQGPSVGPSTMTPLPQGNLSLPTRDTVHAGPATPAPVKRPQERFQPQTPMANLDEDTDPRSWDERIGPVGIVLIAVGTCLVAWALMMLVL
jgi:serine/threonine protein kinase